MPEQNPAVQKGSNLQNQRPVAQKEPPQRQSDGNTDNTNPPPIVNQPAHDNPIPVRHFELHPLLEVPQQDKDPQEIVSQHPIHSTGNPNVVQDPFDTQMEVPFTEDTVEPVFKRPEMADFEIPPVLEEMIPDGSLIHKHLPKQADIDKILTQINRKYLRKMHLPCSLRDCKQLICKVPTYVTYTMLPCSIDTPSIEGQLRSCNKQCLASMWFKEYCYIYIYIHEEQFWRARTHIVCTSIKD